MPTPHPDPHHHPDPPERFPHTRDRGAVHAGGRDRRRPAVRGPDPVVPAVRFDHPVAITAQAWFDAVAWDLQAEAWKPLPDR